MILTQLKSLQRIGVVPSLDLMQIGRIFLVNRLALISSGICLILTPITYLQGLLIQPILLFISFLLFILPLFWNYRGYYSIAKWNFILVGTGVTCAVSLQAFSQGLYTDTENVLFGFMAVIMMLFQGVQRHIYYWIAFLIVIALKLVKADSMNISTMELQLTIQNITILALILYLFLISFLDILANSLKDVVKQEQTLYSLIDNVPVFMALVDREQRYKIVNANYVHAFNKPRNEIINAYCADILPKNIWDVHGPLVVRALNGESPDFLERTEMPDGSVLFATGRYVPIIDENGEIQHVTVFVDDVTQLKNVEDQLKEELKEKNKLFSIIAHDIKSPLNLFEGLLNASDSHIISQEEFLIFKQNLRDRFFSLQETINGLLEWSRLQLDRIQPSPELFMPDKPINELIGVFRPIAENKHIEIDQIGEPKEVFMDKNHFKIILRNLLHNALKFTPNKGSITIEYAMNDDSYLITVADSGVGMSQDYIDRILEKKEVSSSPGTMGETGTGLGLGLSIELLEKNGGSVMIGSNKSAGTKFILKLPM